MVHNQTNALLVGIGKKMWKGGGAWGGQIEAQKQRCVGRRGLKNMEGNIGR